MIRAGLTILAAAVFATLAGAQSQSSPPPQTPQAPGSLTAAPETAKPQLPNGPAVNAELNSSLDSKKAKVGDKVEAHTTEVLKDGDTVLPKGTKLIGHVTEATARSKGDTDSTLAIQFDKAVPKKEQEIPLNIVIMAIAPPAQASYSSSPSPGSEPSSNPNSASAQGSPMGRPQSPSPTPNPGNYPNSSADNSQNPSAGSPGVAGPLPANSRGIYGIKDLKLMMNTKENVANTVITSAGKDVRLDSGTRLLLVTQSGAPAPSGQ